MTALERIMAKVGTTDAGCWEFTGYRNPGGYGKASLAGVVWLAHRLTYTLLVGPIPEGMQIDHLCRNRACVNPDHLETVTQQENIRRGESSSVLKAKYAAMTACRKGHPRIEPHAYVNARGERVCRDCKAESRARTRNRERQNELQRQRRAAKRAKAGVA